MMNKNELTYVFKNKKTNKVMCFLPLFSVIKFISSTELGFASHHAAANTCEMVNMLKKVLDGNKYLTQFVPNVLGLNIPQIHNILSQNASEGQRDGWNRFVGPNPKLAAELFNTDNKKQNLNIDISCAGKADDDMHGVVFDDFISKYFDKAKTAKKELHRYDQYSGLYNSYNATNKEILYYRNLNITGTSKLVTGLSNFNAQVFRRELLKHNMFLGNDMNVYTIGSGQFLFAQDPFFTLYTGQITRCFKIITENVWADDNGIEHNLYNPQEANQYAEAARQYLSNCFTLMNHSLSDNGFYDSKSQQFIDDFELSYDYEDKRFVMKYRNGVERDATAWLYDQLCDAVTKNQVIRSTRKPLKNFLDEQYQLYQNELNMDNNQNYVPARNSLYRSVMLPTQESHNTEKLNLVNNIVGYFEKGLAANKLNEVQITSQEKEDMKKCIFEQTPIEFFFRNPHSVSSAIEMDSFNLEHGSNSETYVINYILSNGIESILTDQGLELLNMVKKELVSDTRIAQDDYFNEYKLQNEHIYQNNRNRKTKIEFSVLKALVECINDGPDAYKHFFGHLSNYLNYFFCNENNLSKKDLTEKIDKEYNDITNQLKAVNQKIDGYNNGIKTNIPKNEVEQKYGVKQQLKSKQKELHTQQCNLKKEYLFDDKLKEALEADYDSQYDNKGNAIPLENRETVKVEKFAQHFLGYDESLLNGIRKEIEKFVDDNSLLDDKILENIEDRKEKVSAKTDMLIGEIKSKISELKTKINIEWIELCIKYVLIRDKMKKQTVSDGIVTQDNIEKNPDEYLNFLILDLFIKFKEADNEFKDDQSGVKKSQAYKDDRIMYWFNFLQNFINAGYFLTNDCTPDEMCEYIYHVHDIEFFMNHDPGKLSALLANGEDDPADALINFLFKGISFGNEEKKKQVIKTFKMMVCQFSIVLSSTKYMTQSNMMKFDFGNRKFLNGVLYGNNGISDCFMVPIQTAYNKAKEISPQFFNQNIEDILPKLPEGMKWADTNKDCDLFFDNAEAEWEMLPVDKAEGMFVDNEKLSQAAQQSDYCLKLLAKRKSREFDEFLMSDDIDNDISSNINIFKKAYKARLRNIDNLSDLGNFWDACRYTLTTVAHTINDLIKDNKKIGLTLVDSIISRIGSNLRKYMEDNTIQDDAKTCWLNAIFIGAYKDQYKVIETITSLVGNIYFKWNNAADESERAHCENILSSVLGVLEIALKVMNPEAIFGNNKDLILWLYLMYKKAKCDNDFANRNQSLTLDNRKYFLKAYKIDNGIEEIFKKNIFYMDDRRNDFIMWLYSGGFGRIANFISSPPQNFEFPYNENILTLEKYRELSGESNKSKMKLKALFERRIEKDNLREQTDKEIRDANNNSIIEMFKSISDPEKILKTLNESSNPKHLFWAFRNLCQGKIANKSPEWCNQELQKLLLSNESENIIKKLFRDSKIGFNRSFNKAYDDQINMSIDSIEILSDLVLNKNMKISLTTATDLVAAIQGLFVNLSDEEINRRPFDFNEKYKNYFRGDRNIFDFVVKIIGQISVSSINETADADKKLKTLLKSLDHIFNSEVMGRAKNPQEMLSKHKDLGLWMYSLYKRTIYDKDQNDNHNKDEDVLLKECKIEATPDEMRKQGIILDGSCINEFEKWFESSYNNFNGFEEFGNIYQYLCENTLVDLTSNQDWTAFFELSERFPNKIKDLLLSDEKDSVISKLCLSVDELFKPLEIKMNVGSGNNPIWIEVQNPTTNQIATHKAATQLHWVRRYFDIYSMIKEKEKLSFRVALSYIKFVHDICRYLREFKLGSSGFTMGIEKLWPKPLEAILDAIEKISFTKGDIEQFASKEEYDELLKIIQDEVNYYNTDDRNITDEVLYKLRKEGKEPKQDDKYFAQDKKSDLLWYLSLLNEKINNGNDCSAKDDGTIEFKNGDSDYPICDCKLSKILNGKNQEENGPDNLKILSTVISRFKDEKFLSVTENSGLEHWKEICVTHLEKNLKQIKLNKMTGKLKNVFKKEYTQVGEMFLEQLENRGKKIKASKILKNRILTVDRKRIAKVFKPWRSKAIKLRNRDNKLTQFNDLLAKKRENALSDAFTEIKSKFDESKKLDGAKRLNNITKKLNGNKIVNLQKRTLSTWNNVVQNIKEKEKVDTLNNAITNLDKGVKGKLKGGKKEEFLDALKNKADSANNVEKDEIANTSSNDANKISNPNNDKKAILSIYSGRIEKSVVAIILDCVLATLAIVFLKEIALIVSAITAAAFFVGLCIYLISNIICYNAVKSEIAEQTNNTNDHEQEIGQNDFDLSKYQGLDNGKESNHENINKDNDLNI